MKKRYTITEEEFGAIQEAVTEALDLWAYDFIEASNKSGSAMSMSKETFFESLRKQFIIT